LDVVANAGGFGYFSLMRDIEMEMEIG
jgi:hypothetical protein